MSFLGFGAGLRPPHYCDILEGRVRSVEWFEAISENFLGFKDSPEGRPLELLLRVRKDFPVVMHGVSLSIGGTDPLNMTYLSSLKELYAQVDPAWISDHLCWTGVHGHNLHDLLPLPYTRETVNHVASRIKKVQDFLGRQLTIENVSSYLSFSQSEMSEWEFLSEIYSKTGCGLLLDVNNVFVSAHNHGFDAEVYIRGLPMQAITQIHLAGHSSAEALLIDTHDAPVCEGVWDLYAFAIKHLGPISTLVEWDGNIPSFERLEEEVTHARNIALRTLKPGRASAASGRPGEDLHGSSRSAMAPPK
ncbi:MAG: DUF692 domain-containing protein [Bdellovibrionota bacterium]